VASIGNGAKGRIDEVDQAGITSRDYKQGLQAGIKELEDS